MAILSGTSIIVLHQSAAHSPFCLSLAIFFFAKPLRLFNMIHANEISLNPMLHLSSFEIWLNHESHKLSIQNPLFSSTSVDGILSIGNKSDLRLTELATGESRLLADLGGGSDEEMTFAAAVACEGRVVLGMRNDYVHCYKTSDDNSKL